MSPTERFLAVVLHAWVEWPGIALDDEDDARESASEVHNALDDAGLIDLHAVHSVTDKGCDLLDRARKAGVLPRTPLTVDEARAWAVAEIKAYCAPDASPNRPRLVARLAALALASNRGDVPPEVRKP
jgi:hypothetical protein